MKYTQWILVAMLMMNPSTVFAGWGVGNGGDWLRMQFQKAQEHAAYVTLRIDASALESSGVSDDVKSWIIEHKQQLAADISLSKLQWTDADQPSCAYTETNPAADIILSFEACAKSTKDFTHAGMLIIHESVHHFGFTHDDSDSKDFADSVALAIYSTWQAGHIEWQNYDLAGEARAQHSAVWTGDAMIVYGGIVDANNYQATNTGFVFDPLTKDTQELSTVNAPVVHNHQALWTNDQMIIWGGLSSKVVNGNRQQVWNNSGAIYDVKTNQWLPLVNPFGPKTVNVYRPDSKVQTIITTGKKLIVFGGVLDPYDAGSAALPGAIYDLETQKWKALTAPANSARKQGHAAVWTGDKMIVWGGVKPSGQYTGEGFTYDLKSGKWNAINSAKAPVGIDHQVAVWTGDSMIVFGGYYSSRDIRGMGGVYDLKSNSWKPFTTETALARIGHTAVWTGQELLIFAGKCRRPRLTLGGVVAFNPKSETWRTTASKNASVARYDHTAVWTGSKMIVFGGSPDAESVFSNGGIYYP